MITECRNREISKAVARGASSNFWGKLSVSFGPSLGFAAAVRLTPQPPVDYLDTEAPVATNAKPRQLTFPEKPIDCAFVNLQKI
jgi:hypothetical protein